MHPAATACSRRSPWPSTCGWHAGCGETLAPWRSTRSAASRSSKRGGASRPATSPAVSNSCSRSRWRSRRGRAACSIDELHARPRAGDRRARGRPSCASSATRGRPSSSSSSRSTSRCELADRAYFLEQGEVRFEGPPHDAGRAARPRPRRVPRPTRLRRSLPNAPRGTDRARPERGSKSVTCRSTSVESTRSTTCRSRWARARSSVSSARTAPARRRSSTSCPASPRATTAPSRCAPTDRSWTSTQLPAHARARLGLGRSFQDGRLFPALTVTETIAVALEHAVTASRSGGGRAAPAVGRAIGGARHRTGGRAARARGTRAVRGQVRARAVDRDASHRRPRVRDRARAVRAPPRRAVERDRAARGRGARAAPRNGPRLARREHARDRARPCRCCARSRTGSSPSTSGRVVAEGTPDAVLGDPVVRADVTSVPPPLNPCGDPTRDHGAHATGAPAAVDVGCCWPRSRRLVGRRRRPAPGRRRHRPRPRAATDLRRGPGAGQAGRLGPDVRHDHRASSRCRAATHRRASSRGRAATTAARPRPA